MNCIQIKEIIEKIYSSNNPNLKKYLPKKIKNIKIEYTQFNEQDNETFKYDYNNNTLIINMNYMTNNEEESKKQLYKMLMCGLIQILATSYKCNIPKKSGFGSVIKKVHEEKLEYENLTKEYACLIASEIDKEENNSNNIIQMLLKQLEIIIGKEKMLEAFFGQHENKLEKEINKIDDKTPAKELLNQISSISCDTPLESIECIQEKLIYLFEKKVLQIKKHQEEQLQENQQLVRDLTKITMKKFDNSQAFLDEFARALEINQEIEEQQSSNNRIIREMQEKFNKYRITTDMITKRKKTNG